MHENIFIPEFVFDYNIIGQPGTSIGNAIAAVVFAELYGLGDPIVKVTVSSLDDREKRLFTLLTKINAQTHPTFEGLEKGIVIPVKCFEAALNIMDSTSDIGIAICDLAKAIINNHVETVGLSYTNPLRKVCDTLMGGYRKTRPE